jgi:hypothetical protein
MKPILFSGVSVLPKTEAYPNIKYDPGQTSLVLAEYYRFYNVPAEDFYTRSKGKNSSGVATGEAAKHLALLSLLEWDMKDIFEDESSSRNIAKDAESLSLQAEQAVDHLTNYLAEFKCDQVPSISEERVEGVLRYPGMEQNGQLNKQSTSFSLPEIKLALARTIKAYQQEGLNVKPKEAKAREALAKELIQLQGNLNQFIKTHGPLPKWKRS